MKQHFAGEHELPLNFNTIYEAPFKKVMMYKPGGTIVTIWNHSSLHITEEEYKIDALYFVDLVKKHQARNMVADNRGNLFPITPEIQRWYNESVSHLIGEHRVYKWAVVLNENLMLHNMLDEVSLKAKSHPVLKDSQFRFFSNNVQAFNWLNK